LVSFDDERSDDIQSKVEQLRDTSQIDLNTQLNLWRQTIHFRRNQIRDQPTSEILEQFPGYNNSLLVRLFVTYHYISINKFIYAIDIRRNPNLNEDGFESCYTTSNSCFTRQIDFCTCFYHW